MFVPDCQAARWFDYLRLMLHTIIYRRPNRPEIAVAEADMHVQEKAGTAFPPIFEALKNGSRKPFESYPNPMMASIPFFPKDLHPPKAGCPS